MVDIGAVDDLARELPGFVDVGDEGADGSGHVEGWDPGDSDQEAVRYVQGVEVEPGEFMTAGADERI